MTEDNLPTRRELRIELIDETIETLREIRTDLVDEMASENVARCTTEDGCENAPAKTMQKPENGYPDKYEATGEEPPEPSDIEWTSARDVLKEAISQRGDKGKDYVISVGHKKGFDRDDLREVYESLLLEGEIYEIPDDDGRPAEVRLV